MEATALAGMPGWALASRVEVLLGKAEMRISQGKTKRKPNIRNIIGR